MISSVAAWERDGASIEQRVARTHGKTWRQCAAILRDKVRWRSWNALNGSERTVEASPTEVTVLVTLSNIRLVPGVCCIHDEGEDSSFIGAVVEINLAWTPFCRKS